MTVSINNTAKLEQQENFGDKAKRAYDTVINVVTEIFTPVLPVLLSMGVLKGILQLLTIVKVLSAESDLYLFFYNMADAFFYYLPVMVAFTTAKRFKLNPFVSVMIALASLYPSMGEMLAKGGGAYFLGIPIPNVSYSSVLIPIFFAVALQWVLERLWRKILGELLFGLLGSLFCLIVMLPCMMLVFGPVGSAISEGIANGYNAIYAFSPILAGAVLGALVQPMIIVGLQYGLIPIILTNLAETGTDTILAFFGPTVFAIVGMSLAYALKVKDPNQKALGYSSAVSAVCTISEPALFGYMLPLKRPLYYACGIGAVGGAVIGATGGRAVAFAVPGFITLPVYVGDGFVWFIITCLACMVAGFLVLMVFGYGSEKDLARLIRESKQAEAEDGITVTEDTEVPTEDASALAVSTTQSDTARSGAGVVVPASV